ncbi:unnamed protein product [Discula destructiva]
MSRTWPQSWGADDMQDATADPYPLSLPHPPPQIDPQNYLEQPQCWQQCGFALPASFAPPGSPVRSSGSPSAWAPAPHPGSFAARSLPLAAARPGSQSLHGRPRLSGPGVTTQAAAAAATTTVNYAQHWAGSANTNVDFHLHATQPPTPTFITNLAHGQSQAFGTAPIFHCPASFSHVSSGPFCRCLLPPTANTNRAFLSLALANYNHPFSSDPVDLPTCEHQNPSQALPSPDFFVGAPHFSQAPDPETEGFYLPRHLDDIHSRNEQVQHEDKDGPDEESHHDNISLADEGVIPVDEGVPEEEGPWAGVEQHIPDWLSLDEDLPIHPGHGQDRSAASARFNLNMPSAIDGGSRKRNRVMASFDEVAGPSRQKRPRSQSTVSVASRAAAKVRKTSRQAPVMVLDAEDMFFFEDDDTTKVEMVDMTADDNVPEELQVLPDDRISTKLSKFECIICLDTASTLTVTHCGHMFCGACLHQAMHAEVTKKICPMCRQKLDDRQRNVQPKNSAKTFFHLEMKLELTKSQGKQPVRPVSRR